MFGKCAEPAAGEPSGNCGAGPAVCDRFTRRHNRAFAATGFRSAKRKEGKRTCRGHITRMPENGTPAKSVVDIGLLKYYW